MLSKVVSISSVLCEICVKYVYAIWGANITVR